MKRFHVHVAVRNLDENIHFYSTLFGQEPTIVQDDYAKWMLDDPYLNFALSKRTLVGNAGINHVGLQAETDEELHEIHTRLIDANQRVMTEQGVECCYAKSDKHWAKDPQGLAWETFRSLDSVQHYYGDEADATATGVSLLNKAEGKCSARGCMTNRLRRWVGHTLGCC